MLIYKGFIGQIDYQSKTERLVGEVVNSVDLLEFDGASAMEIKYNFRRCVDEYLTLQNELAGDSPTPFVGNFSVCLSTEKQGKVIRAAQRQGQSVSHWLNARIDSHLNHYFAKTA